MSDLGDASCDSFLRNDAVAAHGRVQRGNKNARLAAGVRHDALELLLGDGHRFFPGKKIPLDGGGW